MNVIHVINNPVWGGGERYVLDLATEQRAEGHNVIIVSRPCEAVCTPFEKAGFIVKRVSLRGFLDPMSPRHLARLTDSMKGDSVIHVHNFKTARIAVAAKRLAKNPGSIRVICTRHLVRPAKTNYRDIKLYSDLDAIIFVSQASRDEFLSSHPEIDVSRLHVVHNSIRLPDLPPIPKEKPVSPLKLIFAGRLCAEKGLEVLFDALAMLTCTDWTLTLCGTGDNAYISTLKTKAAKLGIADRITFAGHKDDIFSEIDRHNIGVLPTVIPEAFPLNILECMARGVPMITTDSGGQKEAVINGLNGLLITPDDVCALADAIAALASDPRRLSEMSRQAGTLFYRQFSYAEFYKKISDIYHA